ncbi:hypothetical protein [Nocardiopsis halotolerans]|uniref:hypothetical protein n=1 Tax=Nocardiopsis halotolerans TaxID=124252 RepID=UPI001267A0DB|nr:hypothetical protein [Nocardiopsis halotolerans]
MSGQPLVQASESPVVPRPAPSPTALREAVARITPPRVREFDRQLVEASTNAQTGRTLGPLWLFRRSWAQFVEVHRYPDVARRHEELLAMVERGHSDTRRAAVEISRILAWADGGWTSERMLLVLRARRPG